MNCDDLFWHDGLLQSIDFQLNEFASLKLSVMLYDDLSSESRKAYTVTICSPTRIISNLDVLGLIDNQGAGNISDGKIFGEKNSRIVLILNDGYFEALSERIEIEFVK